MINFLSKEFDSNRIAESLTYACICINNLNMEGALIKGSSRKGRGMGKKYAA
jgi:hypothetical protein